MRRYFEQIDQEIVAPNIIQGEANLRARRSKGSDAYRTGPVLRIARELGLFEYLERPEVRARLFPTYPDFRIARAGDEVAHARNPERKLTYSLAENGDCRFTFRWLEGDGTHGGVRSRGYGQRDASDPNKAGDTLEPQINMVKLDPQTGAIIYDKDTPRQERRAGNWRAQMVTLPLVTAVRELQAGQATCPVAHSPFAELLSPQERARAGYPQ